MAKQFTHSHTAESVAKLDKAKLANLRANAERLGAADLVAICDAELVSRKPVRAARSSGATRTDDIVVGYHFTCSRDLGVTDLGGGRFKSRSWVVAEDNVKASLAAGAYLALHESRAEPSYRQGKIIGYELASRDIIAKRNTGIEFLVEATDAPKAWIGNATGEKGYNWASMEAEDEK